MNRYAAIIDACVLGGGLKRNIILSLAEAGLFRPYWSARILDETEKAILTISK
ncbi:MAG: PIN domain-containing protein, partial [Rhodobacterales bacterium]